MNKATGANDTPLGTPVRMSPVNDIPVVEENTQNTPAAKTPMKRKAESEITESNVRFHHPPPGLGVLIINRIPLNRPRRKRGRKRATARPRRLSPRSGPLVPLVMFLKPDRALIGEVREEAQIDFGSYDDREPSPVSRSPICQGTPSS